MCECPLDCSVMNGTVHESRIISETSRPKDNSIFNYVFMALKLILSRGTAVHFHKSFTEEVEETTDNNVS